MHQLYNYLRKKCLQKLRVHEKFELLLVMSQATHIHLSFSQNFLHALLGLWYTKLLHLVKGKRQTTVLVTQALNSSSSSTSPLLLTTDHPSFHYRNQETSK